MFERVRTDAFNGVAESKQLLADGIPDEQKAVRSIHAWRDRFGQSQSIAIHDLEEIPVDEEDEWEDV